MLKNFGVGTYGPIRRPRIPLFKGGESAIWFSLGRQLVNLQPVAQRSNAFTQCCTCAVHAVELCGKKECHSLCRSSAVFMYIKPKHILKRSALVQNASNNQSARPSPFSILHTRTNTCVRRNGLTSMIPLRVQGPHPASLPPRRESRRRLHNHSSSPLRP